MDRMILIALLLVSALGAAAQSTITTVPPIPLAGEPVELRIPEVCSDAMSTVARTGFDITVTLNDFACGGVQNPIRQTYAVDIGPLPPGEYRVTAILPNEEEPPTIIARGTFIVADRRPFRLHPAALPANAAVPYEVAIELDPAGPNPCTRVDDCTVRIAGQVVAQQRTATGRIYVTVPPHAPGLVDVQVNNEVAQGALYFYDRNATPDLAYFERILLPILFNTRGVNSDWRSEAVVWNSWPWTIETFTGTRFAPLSRQKLEGGQFPRGLAYVVPRSEAENLALALRVRDVMQSASGFGTNIPVVRERDMFRSTLTLLNVPLDPRYRVKLRVYAFDVREGAEANVTGAATESFVLKSDCTEDGSNCVTTPAYAEMDLRPIAGAEADLFIDLPPGSLGWAFATVTNNRTQQVTIVTPDGAGGKPCFICSVP